MGVPGHDQRDYEFAKKYNLPIKQVIKSSKITDISSQAIIEKNNLINSGEFNGLDFEKAFLEIEKKARKIRCGKRKTNYRLRDWGVSRSMLMGLGLCTRFGVDGFPLPKPMLSSDPSINSLMDAIESAASTGLRKYWTVRAVPKLMGIFAARAASTTNELRHSRLSVTQSCLTPPVLAIWPNLISSGIERFQ